MDVMFCLLFGGLFVTVCFDFPLLIGFVFGTLGSFPVLFCWVDYCALWVCFDTFRI